MFVSFSSDELLLFLLELDLAPFQFLAELVGSCLELVALQARVAQSTLNRFFPTCLNLLKFLPQGEDGLLEKAVFLGR